MAVNLAGTNTVRITTPTGLCYPNYLMLVPASAPPVGFRVSAALSGGNIILSFPTQAGVVYRVLSRDDLGSSTWTPLTTVTGDGSVKSVSDPATGAQRYYRVVSP